MIKKLLVAVVILTQSVSIFSQTNINLLDNYIFPAGRGDLSDVWGYSNGTQEYALVGLFDGLAIVDVTNPNSANEVFYISDAQSTWRDIKVWNDHAYITNESSGGLMIIDMSNLPGAITGADVYYYGGSTYPFTSAHDLFIDENGVAYVMGADNGTGGAIMLDLTGNPQVPTELGRYDDYYFHDGMVRGDTLWGAAVYDGFFVAVDVSNKSNPITMATSGTIAAFTHNVWISGDGQTLFTTDEVSGGFIGAYDVSNLSNITELDRIQSSPGQNVIVHNTFFINDYLVTSYYRDGITIHDVSNPSNMIEVGNYDTSPAFSGDGFNGCWGVYPYLPSGIILASDIENGLFVLGPTYVRGAALEGNVTDAVTTGPLDNVLVDIVTSGITTNTDIAGDYATGISTPGTYNVIYSKFGFIPDTIFNLVLTTGTTVIQNVQLDPIATVTLQGQVIESGSSAPIANASVKIWSSQFTTTVTTDVAGNFSIPGFIEGPYDVTVGKWSYKTTCVLGQNLLAMNNPYVYSLDIGYYDDFTFDFGWNISGSPTTGDWERGVPDGTTYFGFPSNPGIDVVNDCGNEAYVTGNGGGGAGNDDIDDGITVLTSPVFDLSSYNDAYLHFDRWFFNAGNGGSGPNDSLTVQLSNGSQTQVIDFADVNDVDLGVWSSKSFQLSSIMPVTNNMTLIVRAMDVNGGHIAEGGLDRFIVVDSAAVGIEDNELESSLTIYPNPFTSEINIVLNNVDIKNIRVEILDVSGRKIDEKTFKNTSTINYTNNYKRGIYFMNVYGNGILIKTEKVVKF
jgi:choice-of-anchor B domain-containing protein